MLIESKHFGNITIDEDKILTFKEGLIGLPDKKKFALIYESEEEQPLFSWLQSLDDKSFALPVINPFMVFPEYNPVVDDALLEKLGELYEEDLLVFTVVVVPEDMKKMTVNLKGPIIVNAKTKKSMQIMVQNEDYTVRHSLYERIQKFQQLKVGE